MTYPSYSPAGGRKYREDGSLINEANYIAPQPNGDQVITVAEAGVVTLTPPNEGSIKAFIQPTMQIYTRFNAEPTATTGRSCAAGGKVECESAEEIEQCRILATAAGTIYVDYSK